MENYLNMNMSQQISSPLSPSELRDLNHLVDYAMKAQNETKECSFHPKINPKTEKIMQIKN